jgi:uncharacterized membrane protein YtjA (UPF0391 family)
MSMTLSAAVFLVSAAVMAFFGFCVLEGQTAAFAQSLFFVFLTGSLACLVAARHRPA